MAWDEEIMAQAIHAVYSEDQEKVRREYGDEVEGYAEMVYNGDNSFTIIPGDGAVEEFRGPYVVTVTRKEV